MSIRKRKPFELGKYLPNIATQRIQKLEEIKQLLLELDNRLKMENVGLRELTGISAGTNDEEAGFSDILQSFPAENKPDVALNGGSTLSPIPDTSDIHAQAPDISSGCRSTRSFLVAQYPSDSVNNTSIPFENLDTYQLPEIIDITNQTPRKPGLYGSLEPEAFLKFASDLVGDTIPSKPLGEIVLANKTQRSS
ncbi:unnamed protein product [Rodentolepis nana]|uniref:Uncharacterized protein n=1 Tax=Rodentolepis nana TaxID=102285 RepID=A0A0R3TM72_RODNA|nr:unnamed protein product [Rodentolepis nana]